MSSVLSLGDAPLANRLPPVGSTEVEPRYPLALTLCRRCSLLQLTDIVPPAILFEDYPYLSSYSDTMSAHAAAEAAALIADFRPTPGSLIVEIGSNDGYLLKHFREAGFEVLGIDPSGPAAEVARQQGIQTRQAFFDEALAETLLKKGLRPSIVLANNVMAHNPNLNGMLAGIKTLLGNGLFVMETPYVRDFVERLAFDTIYHEHVFYYSVTALSRAFERLGLTLTNVVPLPIHGGSIRVFATRTGTGSPEDGVRTCLRTEEEWGIDRPEQYQDFASRVEQVRHDVRDFLLERRHAGRRIGAYGAAAKGAILVHAAGVGENVLDFVVDRNPRKQGHYLPGTRVPIVGPEHLAETAVDDLLILAWNLVDEVVAQQDHFRRRGGRFLVALPEPREL
jgi:SAM-dependent methyltransferase